MYLFETKKIFAKSCKLVLNAQFLENKYFNKLPLGLCRLILSRLYKYRAVDLSSRPPIFTVVHCMPQFAIPQLSINPFI